MSQNILCLRMTLRMTGQALEICRQLWSSDILILIATQSIVTKHKVRNTLPIKKLTSYPIEVVGLVSCHYFSPSK